MKPRSIHLEIDVLTLHGFDPRETAAITDALRRELHLSLSSRVEAGLIPSTSNHGFVEAESLTVNPQTRPEDVGASSGRCIASNLFEADRGRRERASRSTGERLE